MESKNQKFYFFFYYSKNFSLIWSHVFAVELNLRRADTETINNCTCSYLKDGAEKDSHAAHVVSRKREPLPGENQSKCSRTIRSAEKQESVSTGMNGREAPVLATRKGGEEEWLMGTLVGWEKSLKVMLSPQQRNETDQAGDLGVFWCFTCHRTLLGH